MKQSHTDRMNGQPAKKLANKFAKKIAKHPAICLLIAF